MREIKFRAWDENEKIMILADSFYLSDEFEPFIDSVKRAQESFRLMQYTGLKDKNGIEIYEGDIIDTKQAGIEVVKIQCEYDMIGYRLYWEKGIVLGNIYENPELLEEK